MICALTALIAAFPLATGQKPASAIAPTRNPIVLGDSVTLRWYITGTKVVLSGGKFGKGIVVTGKTSAVDSPRRATKYTLESWYQNPADSKRLLHAKYAAVVDVLDPQPLGLQTYRDSRGWRLLHPKEWKRDKVDLPDPVNNALLYFQEEEDSLERLAVAVLPVKEQSAAALMKRVEADLPSRYDDAEVISRQDISFEEVPAILTVVSGKDTTHSGARTQSVILAFVHAGRGYVISARTAAARFSSRQPLLMKLVKSFAFLPATPPRSTVSGSR